jgi:homoserine dehydrogenase
MSNTRFGVALLGCGTIGSGVYELLKGQVKDIESKFGFQFEIRKVLVRDLKKPRKGLKLETDVLTTNFQDILNDPSIDVVIEVMGGETPAKDYLFEALRSGRHVITANKTLMGKYGEKLVEKARQHDRFFGFSAAVAGFHQFVPSIVKSIMITELVGIFNGTTNFILTKLAEKSFDEVLKEAIDLGYAESDHHNDTEGWDTRNKLVVASKLAFGVFLDREEIPVAGITNITKEDVAHAHELGYKIKLLGVSRIVEDDKLTAFVAPALIPETDLLARVEGVDNGILVRDKFRGVQGMSAAGAGKDATAMAIFSDLVSVANGERALWPDASLSRRNLKFTRHQPPASFYVRIDVPNQPGALANVSKHFARNEINITHVIQRTRAETSIASIVFMLGPAKQKSVQKVLDELIEAKKVTGEPVMLRIEQSPQVDSAIAHSSEVSTNSGHKRSSQLITA